MSKTEVPQSRRAKEKGKITSYPDKEVADLYYLGSENGYDTPKIVRDAITEALLSIADKLKKPIGGSAS